MPDISDPSEAPNLDELLGRTRVKAPPRDSRYDKWCRWLEEIDRELTDVFLNRSVWRGVDEILRKNPDLPPSHYFTFQALNYATTEAVAVRRQAEVDPRVVTLGRLIDEISSNPSVMSRQRHVALYPWGMQHLGDDFFNAWAEPGTDHVDPATVLGDLDGMRGQIRRYVDKRIAHAEKRRPKDVPVTFDDLDRAIDALGETFRKYSTLVRAVDRVDMVPVPQYDWVAPFRIAWLTE